MVARIGTIGNAAERIDHLAVDGLLGVNNSLAYKVHEIEKHFHHLGRVYGKSADQSGVDWALENSLTTFRAISGNGVFGADTNDEAKVWGTGDTSDIVGDTKFDLSQILVVTLSVDTPYILRLVYGTGTMAAAIIAKQYSCILAQNSVTGAKANGAAIPIAMRRLTYGVDKIWLQAACASDNATADVLIGLHGYVA
jgi:hypothetical protein